MSPDRLPGHCTCSAVPNLQGSRCLLVPQVARPSLTTCHSVKQKNGLPPPSVSWGFSLVCVGPQWRSCQSFTFRHASVCPLTAPSSGNSPSASEHLLQARTPSLPPPAMEKGPRHSIQPQIWGAASSLRTCSGFRPLLCHHSCSSILWCGTTIAEQFHHLQRRFYFSSALIQLFALRVVLQVWQWHRHLPRMVWRGAWWSLTPNLEWAQGKRHDFTEVRETIGLRD